MQNKPLLLVAGASLLVASAVTLASSTTTPSETGRRLAAAPSAVTQRAAPSKQEACLGDNDEVTTLVAYMQASAGFGEPPYQQNTDSRQNEEPTSYDTKSYKKDAYQPKDSGAPDRGGSRERGGAGKKQNSYQSDQNYPTDSAGGGERVEKPKMGGGEFFAVLWEEWRMVMSAIRLTRR